MALRTIPAGRFGSSNKEVTTHPLMQLAMDDKSRKEEAMSKALASVAQYKDTITPMSVINVEGVNVVMKDLTVSRYGTVMINGKDLKINDEDKRNKVIALIGMVKAQIIEI